MSEAEVTVATLILLATMLLVAFLNILAYQIYPNPWPIITLVGSEAFLGMVLWKLRRGLGGR